MIKDVPRDGNCLFSAIIMAYLEPVAKDEIKFKERYIKLFDHDNNYQTFFSNFFGQCQYIKELVLLFRNLVVDYISHNLNTIRPDNKASFWTMLLDSDINKENLDQLSWLKASEDSQIELTMRRMKKDGTWAGSIEIEVICNILGCIIIRNEEQFEPDNYETNNKIKLIFADDHYQYLVETNECDNFCNNIAFTDEEREKKNSEQDITVQIEQLNWKIALWNSINNDYVKNLLTKLNYQINERKSKKWNISNIFKSKKEKRKNNLNLETLKEYIIYIKKTYEFLVRIKNELENNKQKLINNLPCQSQLQKNMITRSLLSINDIKSINECYEQKIKLFRKQNTINNFKSRFLKQ